MVSKSKVGIDSLSTDSTSSGYFSRKISASKKKAPTASPVKSNNSLDIDNFADAKLTKTHSMNDISFSSSDHASVRVLALIVAQLFIYR